MVAIKNFFQLMTNKKEEEKKIALKMYLVNNGNSRGIRIAAKNISVFYRDETENIHINQQ